MQNDKPVIFFEEGIPMTTSLEVARIFEKAHTVVLRAIRNPVIPEDFSVNNFVYVEIFEENASNLMINKSYYKMTRKGFNLIAFGFTGERAMVHKIVWIYAFDAIEAELARRILEGPAPQPQIETVEQQEVRPGLQPLYKCARCKEWLPLEAFNRDSSRSPPVQCWCRQCHKDRKSEMKLIEWTPVPQVAPEHVEIKSVPPPTVPPIPSIMPSVPNKILALVRHNPPKSNQRSIPEAEMTEDKQMILRLVRSQREILDIIEARALAGDPNART